MKMTQAESNSFVLDLPLLWMTAVLLTFGLAMALSTTMYPSEIASNNVWSLFVRHLMFLGIALSLSVLVFYMAARKDVFTLLLENSTLLLILCLGLLILTLLSHFGREINGSRRWLAFGFFSVQPGEILKLVLVIYLTRCLAAKEQAYRSSMSATVLLLAPLALPAFLLALQPDYGGIVVLFAVALGMLFTAGTNLLKLSSIAGLIVAALGLLLVVSDYRVERVLNFLDPWQDQLGAGYQLTQSLIAVGNGSWFGVGLGGGMQKLGFLPQVHTDFVFPIIAEELGFAGVLTVVVLFFLLVTRCFQIARRAEIAKFQTGGFFCYGIGIWLGLQAFINMAMTVGILPTKGITLPLFSFGGSSMVVTLISLALVQWVHHETCQRGIAMAPYRSR